MNNDISTEEPSAIDTLIRFWWLWLPIIIWFIFKGRYGTIEIGTVSFYILIFILGYGGFLRGMFATVRESTPKIVFDGGFSTTSGNWREVGNYAVLSLGDIRAFEMDIPGNKIPFNREGTLICPKDALNKVGKNAVITVRTERKTLDELSDNVQAFLLQNGYKPPWRMGYVSEEQMHRYVEDEEDITDLEKPSVEFLLTVIDEANKKASEFKKISQQLLHYSEDVEESLARLRELNKGDTTWEKIKESFFAERPEHGRR